jgi:hypothetical protein
MECRGMNTQTISVNSHPLHSRCLHNSPQLRRQGSRAARSCHPHVAAARGQRRGSRLCVGTHRGNDSISSRNVRFEDLLGDPVDMVQSGAERFVSTKNVLRRHHGGASGRREFIKAGLVAVLV